MLCDLPDNTNMLPEDLVATKAKSTEQDPDNGDNNFFCCYCTESFDNERMMERHKVQCKFGPRLLIQLTLDKTLDGYLCNKLRDSQENVGRTRRLKNVSDESSTQQKAGTRRGKAKCDDTTRRRKVYGCTHCLYSTNHKGNLNQHVLLHDKKKKVSDRSFSCFNCTYSTNCRRNIVMHMSVHKTKKDKRCSYCNFSTKYKYALVGHIRSIHGVGRKPFFCANCDYSANQKHNLVRHVFKEYNRGNWELFACDICDYKGHTQSAVKYHTLRTHSEICRRYSCPGCEKIYKTKIALDNHILQVHPNLTDRVTNKVFNCSVCSFKTTIAITLTRHYFSRHSKANAPRYKCSRCQYVTHLKGNYTVHLKRHESVKDYNCNICMKGFVAARDFEEHIVQTHRDNVQLMKKVNCKIYNCSHCDYITIFASMLKRHSRRHELQSESGREKNRELLINLNTKTESKISKC